MTDFLDRVVQGARQYKIDSDRKTAETAANKLRRWQAFKGHYETVAVNLRQVDGLKLEPKTTKSQGTLLRTLSVRRIEELAAEPPDDDRPYLIELWIVYSNGREAMLAGWVIQWRSWDGSKVKRTYAEDDLCWRGLHDDAGWTTKGLIDETVKDLQYRVDLTAYGGAGQAARAIDL